MPVELWKDIEGYEGLYQVSANGEIKSLSRPGVPGTKRGPRVERLLKNRDTNHGYYSVILYLDGNSKGFLVHRLVAQAFVENPEGKPQVNHKDLNKLNNAHTNLEWASNIENIAHAAAAGRYSGELRSSSKLSYCKAAEIRRKLELGATQTSLAGAYDVSLRAIRAVKLRETWN